MTPDVSWQPLSIDATGAPPPQLDRTGAVALIPAGDRAWAAGAAITLARALARGGRRVFLCDLDLATPRLHTMVGLDRGTGVSDFILFGASPSHVSVELEERLLFVSAGTPVTNFEAVYGDARWHRFVEAATHARACLLFLLPTDVRGASRLLDRAETLVALGRPTELPALGAASSRLRFGFHPQDLGEWGGASAALVGGGEEATAVADQGTVDGGGGAEGADLADEATRSFDEGPVADESVAVTDPVFPHEPSVADDAPGAMDPVVADEGPADLAGIAGAPDFADEATGSFGDEPAASDDEFGEDDGPWPVADDSERSLDPMDGGWGGGELDGGFEVPETPTDPGAWEGDATAEESELLGLLDEGLDATASAADDEAIPVRDAWVRGERPGRKGGGVSPWLVLFLVVVAAILVAGWMGWIDVPGISPRRTDLDPQARIEAVRAAATEGSAGAAETPTGAPQSPEEAGAGGPAEVATPSGPGTSSANVSGDAGPSDVVGPLQGWSLRLAAYRGRADARREADRLAARAPNHLIVVAPVEVGGTRWYRVVSTLARDQDAGESLRADLALALPSEAADQWQVRRAPLAFLIEERSERGEADGRVAELRNVGIDAYLMAANRADGTRVFRVYAGAYADAAEASTMRALLGSLADLDPPLVERRGTRPE